MFRNGGLRAVYNCFELKILFHIWLRDFRRIIDSALSRHKTDVAFVDNLYTDHQFLERIISDIYSVLRWTP